MFIGIELAVVSKMFLAVWTLAAKTAIINRVFSATRSAQAKYNPFF